MLRLSLVVNTLVILIYFTMAPLVGQTSIAGKAHAGEIPVPSDSVILTVTGEIKVTNVGDSAQFDYAGLEGLPLATLQTTTPWTEGEQTFEGVLLRDLLEALGASGETLQATALNDYGIEIPVSEAEDEDIIVAYRQNGDRMSIRKKGPLWVIYPDTNDSPLATERMIWQLNRITVLP